MDLIGQRFVIDIEKARTHKYVKRTGSPGNYKYWYKLPDGRIVAEDDKQEMGKLDHIKRLIVARSKGHHTMDNDAIARHVGIDKKKVGSAERNLRRAGRQWQHGTTGAQRQFSAGHDYTDEHLREAHGEAAPHPEGESAAPARAAEPARAEPARPRASRSRRSAESATATTSTTSTSQPAAPAAGTPYVIQGVEAQEVHSKVKRAVERLTSGVERVENVELNRDGSAEILFHHDKNDGEIFTGREEDDDFPEFTGRRKVVDAVQRALGDTYTVTAHDHEKGMFSVVVLRREGGRAASASAPATPAAPARASRAARPGRSSKDQINARLQERLQGHQIPMTKINDLHNRAERIMVETDPLPTAQQAADKAFEEFKAAGHITATSPAPTSSPRAEARPQKPARSPQAEQAERDLQALREAGLDFGSPAPAASAEAEQATQAAQRAKEAAATAARQRAVEPASPAARELHAVAPDLAEADRPIQEMLEAQRRGENPYLNRAKDIYHNIQADLKPERRDTVRHLLSAINAVKDHTTGKVDEAALLQKYKELSGKNVRGLSGVAEEFEKGTFMTLDEVTGNAPIDVEMERMKRGYAAKQFARMKPFLKQSWTNANPSAPPPMPTFGDVKSWTEHGGEKPSWAGTTRLAMPKDVYDAAHKIGGKPKYPPAWMPIHMMPVWNYVMAKTGDDSAYQARGGGVSPQSGTKTGWKLDMGSQAGYQEGIVMNALRKYVQMRGGHDQLTDIPAHKLSEVNLSHSDIFKGLDPHDMSDKAMKKLMTSKVIDPVALLPFIKEEMKNKPVKKSIELVVDADSKAVSFKKSFVIDENLKKAQLIQKIRAAKAGRY